MPNESKNEEENKVEIISFQKGKGLEDIAMSSREDTEKFLFGDKYDERPKHILDQIKEHNEYILEQEKQKQLFFEEYKKETNARHELMIENNKNDLIKEKENISKEENKENFTNLRHLLTAFVCTLSACLYIEYNIKITPIISIAVPVVIFIYIFKNKK